MGYLSKSKSRDKNFPLMQNFNIQNFTLVVIKLLRQKLDSEYLSRNSFLFCYKLILKKMSQVPFFIKIEANITIRWHSAKLNMR